MAMNEIAIDNHLPDEKLKHRRSARSGVDDFLQPAASARHGVRTNCFPNFPSIVSSEVGRCAIARTNEFECNVFGAYQMRRASVLRARIGQGSLG
jgi:hypothetical protein